MSNLSRFSAFPDDARVWVYVADRPLPSDEQRQLLERLSTFTQEWTSHGRSVDGAVAVLHERFVVLAATIPDGDISGCGIDASVHAIETAAQEIGIEWVPALDVVYRDADGGVQHTSRPAFRALVQEGAITADTQVFDPSITQLSALRHGQFELPARASWHARAFGLAQPA